MNSDQARSQSNWAQYYGPNLGYLQEMYERYINDPNSVDSTFQSLFERLGPPPAADAAAPTAVAAPTSAPAAKGTAATDPAYLKKIVDAGKLFRNIRTYGHLAAHNDPLDPSKKADVRQLDPASY